MTRPGQFERPHRTTAPKRGGKDEKLLRLVQVVALCIGCVTFWGLGCDKPVGEDTLVITEVPSSGRRAAPGDELVRRYPPGSRVALVSSSGNRIIRILSAGLFAAGEPVVAHNGKRIVFVGKSSGEASWQIYEADRDHRGLKVLTDAKGGAKDPALRGDGTLIYVSPADSPVGSQLYAQPVAGQVRQLTFGSSGVSDTTVLLDGRILFVSAGPATSGANTALYTINNDGTEITAFSGQHDAVGSIRRPRDLSNHRVAFITQSSAGQPASAAQVVSTARPFASRAPALPQLDADISCIENTVSGDWLVCMRLERDDSGPSPYSLFRITPAVAALQKPLFTDSGWDVCEAAPAQAHPRPMGRISNVDPSHSTGQILCLNINDTTLTESGTAKRVRILSGASSREKVLGEIEVRSDGSFMAEVPANIPLGFEALDEKGAILRREGPFIWIRPGENRACIGCHEPHNHSPKNRRPLAAGMPVPRLPAGTVALAKTNP